MTAQYPECFQGVKKLKGEQVKIHIDPFTQPVRRVVSCYHGKVEKAPVLLLHEDIIEQVQGLASTRVSPLAAAPRDEPCLCTCHT